MLKRIHFFGSLISSSKSFQKCPKCDNSFCVKVLVVLVLVLVLSGWKRIPGNNIVLIRCFVNFVHIFRYISGKNSKTLLERHCLNLWSIRSQFILSKSSVQICSLLSNFKQKYIHLFLKTCNLFLYFLFKFRY